MNELEGWKEAESKEPMHINSVDVLNDENSKNLDQHKLKNTKSKKGAVTKKLINILSPYLIFCC